MPQGITIKSKILDGEGAAAIGIDEKLEIPIIKSLINITNNIVNGPYPTE